MYPLLPTAVLLLVLISFQSISTVCSCNISCIGTQVPFIQCTNMPPLLRNYMNTRGKQKSKEPETLLLKSCSHAYSYKTCSAECERLAIAQAGIPLKRACTNRAGAEDPARRSQSVVPYYRNGNVDKYPMYVCNMEFGTVLRIIYCYPKFLRNSMGDQTPYQLSFKSNAFAVNNSAERI